MSDRLDIIRKRLMSGNPFAPHAEDLAWAIGEIERLARDRDEWKRAYSGACDLLDKAYAECQSHVILVKGLEALADDEGDEAEAEILAYTRSEIARLDALSQPTEEP